MLDLLFARSPEPGSFWNVNLPEPSGRGAALPRARFCRVDPHPLPVAYELRDGKLDRGRYQDRRQAAEHDVEVCFSGRIRDQPNQSARSPWVDRPECGVAGPAPAPFTGGERARRVGIAASSARGASPK